jgi:hypothetical protein
VHEARVRERLQGFELLAFLGAHEVKVHHDAWTQVQIAVKAHEMFFY